MAKKPIPRAVLEERIRVFEERAAKRRLFAVQFGVYFVNIMGVLGSQAVMMTDNLAATLAPLEIGQVFGAAIVSTLVYAKMQTGKDDLRGMAKKGNVLRVLITAFSNGFMWQTMIGAWW
jgi:hypothetical protein